MSPNRLLQDPGLPASNPTKSYWQSPPNKDVLNIQSSILPSKRDVVVLGSGITGCSVSWWLLKGSSDLSLSVLDAREICSGATGRNGGRINCTAVQDFDKYRKAFGDEVATKIVRFELEHLDAITSFVNDIGPELLERSEVRNVDAVSTFFEDSKLAEFRTLLDNFEAAFPDFKGRWKILDREAVIKRYSITHAKGALVGRAGAAWPYRMVTDVFAHLLRKHSQRFSVEANTPALSIDKDADKEHPYLVKTPRGVIRAKHVIHCTEGHVAHLLPRLRGILVPRRGEMTVQNPASGFPNGNDSWTFIIGDGFDYATQNPKSGEIFIGGGEIGGKATVLGLSSDAEEDLVSLSHLGGILPAAFGAERWGHELPGKKRMVASWTGIMCNSLDKVPLVGLIPQNLLERPAGTQSSGEWMSCGYGGYGMVNAFLSGKALAKMVLGEPIDGLLPEPYVLTEQRAQRLQRSLKKFLSSNSDHVKALL